MLDTPTIGPPPNVGPLPGLDDNCEAGVPICDGFDELLPADEVPAAVLGDDPKEDDPNDDDPKLDDPKDDEGDCPATPPIAAAGTPPARAAALPAAFAPNILGVTLASPK